jgi:hypothetical protein
LRASRPRVHKEPSEHHGKKRRIGNRQGVEWKRLDAGCRRVIINARREGTLGKDSPWHDADPESDAAWLAKGGLVIRHVDDEIAA